MIALPFRKANSSSVLTSSAEVAQILAYLAANIVLGRP